MPGAAGRSGVSMTAPSFETNFTIKLTKLTKQMAKLACSQNESHRGALSASCLKELLAAGAAAFFALYTAITMAPTPRKKRRDLDNIFKNEDTDWMFLGRFCMTSNYSNASK